MSSTCPECGAPLPESGACRAYFHELLALEWRIPGGSGEMPHFLAVTSYNLQHPAAFRPEARAGMRAALEGGLSGRADIPGLRRASRRAFDGSARVLRDRNVAPGDDAARAVPGWPSVWPRTVLDVLGAPPERAVYAARVRAWAEAVADTLRGADARLER